MTVGKTVIADDDVFTRNVCLTPVAIAPGFYGDAVIAGVEQVVFNQHIAAAFGIDAVVIVAMGS